MKKTNTIRSLAWLVPGCLALIVCLGLTSCPSSFQLGVIPTPGAAGKSFPVLVIWEGGGSSGSRGLFGDASVSSVSVLVYDAAGASIGSGTLAKETSYWGGFITVSETGLATFDVYACKPDGTLLYVGKTTQTLTGSGDSVTVAVGAVTLQGGAIQGQAPVLSTAVSLLAGSPTGASGLANGTGTSASFYWPIGVTTDGTNIYVTDIINNEIRRVVIATGEVTLLAGSPTGASGLANGTGTSASFFEPFGITTDGTNLYVADQYNHEIRQIVIATGAVTLLAGSPTGAPGLANGTGTLASFQYPHGITTDGTNLYVADTSNNEIRQIVIATGAVSLLAGSPTGASGMANGTGTSASFCNPYGITTDGTNLYVADQYNHEIRQIVIATGAVTLLAGSPTGASGLANGTGTSASFYEPVGITTDGTNLYVADYGNMEIRQIVIATGAVTLLAGSPTGAGGLANGIGTSASFNGPVGITTDGTNLYVADGGNNEIRKIQ